MPGETPAPFSFAVLGADGPARVGEIRTRHGPVRTPAFMPVGTQGAVKLMRPQDVRASGADMILANTYHLSLRPGAERVARLGGLHRFIDWPHPILTDSGGFQVMSLAPLCEVDDGGVTFRSHIDGALVRLTAERAIEIQLLLGTDIVMQLDQCLRLPASYEQKLGAVQRSLRWAERSKQAFETAPGGTALFGIVQGGDEPSLRERNALELRALGFEGYAIGGLAVGEPQEVMLAMLKNTVPVLPEARPRYLMGVGKPEDVLTAIAHGIDMFDCVLPTRNGRHGVAFTRFGPRNLKNARYAEDRAPVDTASTSAAARRYSRAYLHHLVKAHEGLGAMLLTEINVHYYQTLMAGARDAILNRRFSDYLDTVRGGWAQGEPDL